VNKDLPIFAKYDVRYLVAPTNLRLFSDHHVATLAYRDATVTIWELPHAQAPARAVGCVVTVRTTDSYVTTCARPSVLLRNVLWFPGWSASVNGVPVAVQNRASLQVVALPEGRSVVAFTFLPPYVPAATAACVVGLLSLAVPWGVLATRRRRRRAEAAGLAELGASLSRREPPVVAIGADQPVEQPTGAIVMSAPLDDAAPTSAVPAVTGTRTALLDAPEDDQGPPTSAVAAQEAAPLAADPPTLAVPVATRKDKKRRR
jgi:hypothetical protein